MTILADASPVAHGWTARDLERIAGHAARDHPSSLLCHTDRQETALHLITEMLLTATQPPTLAELHRAASDAISRAVNTERHHRGIAASGGTAPRFARYWNTPGAGRWEDDLVDAIAVRQVLAAIRPSWRRDLEILASEGTYEAAARELGTTMVTFRSRISKARAAVAELWFAPEAAPGMWGSDRRGGTARPRPVTRCVRTRSRDRQAVAKVEDRAA